MPGDEREPGARAQILSALVHARSSAGAAARRLPARATVAAGFAAVAVVVISDVSGPVAALLLPVAGGLGLAEIGRRLPFLRGAGLETVLVLLVPSFLVHANMVPVVPLTTLAGVLQSLDLIGLFVTILIVGSLLSIELGALVGSAMRMVLLVIIGTFAAIACGLLAALALGQSPSQALFFILAPMLAGGVSGGAIPLSVGYATALGLPAGDALARMLPAIVMGNLLALLIAAFVSSWRGKKHEPSMAAAPLSSARPANSLGLLRPGASGPVVVVAMIIIAALHVTAAYAARRLELPVPLAVLILGLVLRLLCSPSGELGRGIVAFYRLCLRWLAYPVLCIVGLLLTPWDKLVEGLAPANLMTVAAAVAGLASAGLVLSRRVGLDTVDGTILTLVRAAMGGTGTFTILNAGRRLDLMPLAQVVTRVGGASTLAAALSVASFLAG